MYELENPNRQPNNDGRRLPVGSILAALAIGGTAAAVAHFSGYIRDSLKGDNDPSSAGSESHEVSRLLTGSGYDPHEILWIDEQHNEVGFSTGTGDHMELCSSAYGRVQGQDASTFMLRHTVCAPGQVNNAQPGPTE